MTQPSLLDPEPDPDRGRDEVEPEPRLDLDDLKPEREPEPAGAQDATDAGTLAAGASSLDDLRGAAAGCQACDLWRDATQTVFGEGPAEHVSRLSAPGAIELVFVGEQPGDREDLEGRPFVGPAGALFDRALADAGIDRTTTYVTNTVKHFKWKPQEGRGAGFRGAGRRRIHAKPNAEEITACRPWLDAELVLLRPRLVVCLGATAAQALLGGSFRVTRQRGEVITAADGQRYLATIHPSAVLRADSNQRDAAYAGLVEDLRTAATTR